MSTNTETLLYGGSGSGKTFLTCMIHTITACKYPGVRTAIIRTAFKHAKASLWLGTLPEVLKFYPKALYEKNETDHVIKWQNGSEIWIDGLDDKDRAEKFLGREYGLISPNELSQFSYGTYNIARTRLRQNIPGLKLRMVSDMNPGSNFHWTHDYFIKKIDPIDKNILRQSSRVSYCKLNPMDNVNNLPESYIEMLKDLPEQKRKRFFEGEFTDAEGAVFTNWGIVDEIPEEAERNGRTIYGLDYGFTVDPAVCVKCVLYGDHLYVDEIVYQTGLVNAELFKNLTSLPKGAIIRADSAEKKSNEEGRRAGLNIYDAQKGPDSIRAGIDWMQSRKIFITRRSQNVINEFQSYTWRIDSGGKPTNTPIDDYNHAIDAIRYASEEFRRRSIQIRVI